MRKCLSLTSLCLLAVAVSMIAAPAVGAVTIERNRSERHGPALRRARGDDGGGGRSSHQGRGRPRSSTSTTAAPTTSRPPTTTTAPPTTAPPTTRPPTTTAPPTTAPPTTAPPTTGRWVPTVGASWQYQLTGTVDTSVAASVFDIDGSDNSAAVVAALHAQGKRAVCYLSAGSWEDWRADAAKFPASVRGKGLDGWPGEQWLDIRQLTTLRPLLAARFDTCKAKGFDGVEPDNVDGYTNDTGFPLTAADQLAYNRMLADLAHERGLAIGLKNDVDQVPQLVTSFDFAVNEECSKYGECASVKPFVSAGKPVFHVEYGTSTAFCTSTKALGFSSILKKLSLDAWRQSC